MPNPFGAPEISVNEMAQRCATDDTFVWLDVREPNEHALVSIADTRIHLLPLSRLAAERLDALPDAVIGGHIDRISPTPVSSTGITSYKVTVVVDETNAALRSGLSATASITTDELRDIVLLPNRAIQIDRSSGRALVEKIVNGVPTTTEVQLGSRNEQYSQILSGVEAGDELAIRSGGGLDQLRSTMFGGG